MTPQAEIVSSLQAVRKQGGDPLAYVSPSRLRTFLQCRLRFYYEKILGLARPSANLNLGKAVHEALQVFHKAVWRGEDTCADAVVGKFAESFQTIESEAPVEYTRKSRDEHLATGERIVRAYLESDLARDGRRILGVEVALRATDIGTAIPVVGVLDLVREGFVAVDFKTTAATPALSDQGWQHEIQMTAYHLLLVESTGEQPGPSELVHLVKLKAPKVIRQELPPVSPQQVARFRSLVDVYVQGVEREDFFPCPGMQCSWCGFREECTAWTGERSRDRLMPVAA